MAMKNMGFIQPKGVGGAKKGKKGKTAKKGGKKSC
jgi:hypothetical protein